MNRSNNIGKTALIMGVDKGEEAGCVEVLLQAGALLNVKNHLDETALIIAVENWSDNFVDLLIKAGADVNVKNHCSETVVMKAVQNRRDSCVDLLLKAGADVNLGDENGDTALTRKLPSG